VRDSDRVLGLLDAKTRKAELGVPMKSHLLVTRYSAERAQRGEMLKVEDIIELLGISFLGVIPESKSVLNNSNQGTPVVLDKESDAAAGYIDAIKRLLGEEQPHRFLTTEKKGFFSRLFAPSNAYAG
jgi:septum site-determining protein MinD